MTYTNALGRVSVLDNLCGFSFANTNAAGDPVPQAPTTRLGTFSTANGIPPTSGVNLVYNDAANGGGAGKRDLLASSPSAGALDLALDGAICQRNLTVGSNIVDGGALDADAAAHARSIEQGIADVQLTARLRGKPALIVHGRADTLIPVNHASRAYYGANQLAESSGRRALSYIEVMNAQHFDTFLGFPGYVERFIPLHVYLIRALNSMHAHLTTGVSLPRARSCVAYRVALTATRRRRQIPSPRRMCPISRPILPPATGSYSTGIRSTSPGLLLTWRDAHQHPPVDQR